MNPNLVTQAVTIVQDLARKRVPLWHDQYEDPWCALCGKLLTYDTQNDPEEHEESCPWRRAKQLFPGIGL